MVYGTTLDEMFVVNDHLRSLITNNNDNNNNHLDTSYKNWLQIFKDYKYHLEILQQDGSILFTKTTSQIKACRFDVENNKYIGLSFSDWFELVLNQNIEIFKIHPSNNTYIGNNDEKYEHIEGNEKYEFSLTDNHVFIYAGYRPLHSSLDQFELDAEYDLLYDIPQLLANGAVDLVLPKQFRHLTPPKPIFKTAATLSAANSNQSSISTSFKNKSPLSDVIPQSNSIRNFTIPSTIQSTPLPITSTSVLCNSNKRKTTFPIDNNKSPAKLSLKPPIEYYYSPTADD